MAKNLNADSVRVDDVKNVVRKSVHVVSFVASILINVIFLWHFLNVFDR